MPVLRPPAGRALAAVLLLLTAAAGVGRAQGILIPGVGPVNRSMAGASVAAPIDPIGALYWNPAGAAGLGRSELGAGVELFYPQSRLTSGIPAGALGGGQPPVPLAGTDKSDPSVYTLPSTGLVYQVGDTPWAAGLGVYVIGGFGANYPAATGNPILTPQPPNGVGLGSVFSELQVVQFAPTVAVWLTDRVAVGFSPTVDIAYLAADPLFISPPNDANRDGFPTYPPGTHRQSTTGAGFQVGVYYTGPGGWNAGASVKSPQWFQPFRFNTTTETGQYQLVKAHFDLPLIASVGVAYTGFPRWVLAVDARYVDYRNTAGFRTTGFDPAGAVTGLGWNSVAAFAAGAQYQATDALSLRLGYLFSTNPIRGDVSMFNVASATVPEHQLFAGASYQVTKAFSLSLAYGHVFANTITGPIISPLGPVPGSFVTSKAAADTVVFGAAVRF